ncbi:plasmid replication initiator TrfA [Xylella fastidiosa]|uniref:Plasmid replication initiator TrfA n=2 Tax=Xylella fastidiosa TaxID=2371 RepID=A0AAJ5R3C9_XYLFS|nr:plasmid replication initiator TrfA [Xylella fastidiosa]WCF29640.1 plasmid replication initiator TrfA [Xylella fastidiosa subsp. fastidiosa]
MSSIELSLTKMRARQEVNLQKSLLQQLQLPIWTDAQRGVPNSLLRSALFAAIQRGKRPYLKRQVMASVENASITYTGIRLCQDYLTVWECLVHVAREQQLGNRCEVTTYQLLRLLDKKDTGGNRRVLRRQLAELQATALEVRQGRYTYSGSLIDEAYHDEETGRAIIVLNQRIVALYQSDGYTRVSWQIRCDLNTSLAKWLHGFYATHRQPYPYSVAKIHELCGSAAKSLKDFQEKTLAPALEELASVCKSHGEHFSYMIERRPGGKSIVYVTRDVGTKLPLTPEICG